jgi:4'-phosphopantetheinyl transferase EntD
MTADMLVSSVLPANLEMAQSIAYSEVYADPPGLAPLPEEEPLIAKSVAKRRNEFITVRYCARIALGELGLPPVPILKGDKGEPCWPDGVVGSLTHCAGYRGAVVGRSAAVRSVGIDAEPHDVLPNGVLDAISLPQERTEIPQAMPEGLHWDRILFCAKEATYKAWFPLTKRWLGFEDAHISFEADGPAAGTFVSRILIDAEALSGPPLTTLQGRWAVERGLVLTAIAL